MFNLNGDTKSIYNIENYMPNENKNMSNENDEHLDTSLSMKKDTKKSKLKIERTKDNEYSLDDFIEVDIDSIEDLEVNDFIRYMNKSDKILKKGGYLVRIYSRVLKDNTEKVYLLLSFNRVISTKFNSGTFSIALNNIEKLYKKIANVIEHGVITNSIDGISSNVDSNVQNIYDELALKNKEITILKNDVENLKRDSFKTDERIKKIVGYIKEISIKINKQ